VRARTPQPYSYTPYMERTDSCVSRFATAAGCAPALLLAHASARADLAARLALFERALFPADAAVRDACESRAPSSPLSLHPCHARRGVRFGAFCFSKDMNNLLRVDNGPAPSPPSHPLDPAARRPRSWTSMCAAAGASFRLDGDDAEFGAFTIQPSFVLRGTPRVTGEAARAANAEAGLLGVAGFAKAEVLGAVLLEEVRGGGNGEALPAAERDAARDAEEGAGAAGKRGGGVKRRRGER
jgi:hypothetical protein